MVLPEPRRQLHGRFLHITDIHPDPHYEYDSSISSSCHRTKPKKEEPRAGYYGTPFRCEFFHYNAIWYWISISSGCDSPFTLSNFTLDFLDKHWASDIDFVICTLYIRILLLLFLFYIMQ
jgi:endopolyphosphatase